MTDVVKTRNGLRVTLHSRDASADRPYVGEIEGFPGRTFSWDGCGNIDEISLDHSPYDLAEDVWNSPEGIALRRSRP